MYIKLTQKANVLSRRIKITQARQEQMCEVRGAVGFQIQICCCRLLRNKNFLRKSRQIVSIKMSTLQKKMYIHTLNIIYTMYTGSQLKSVLDEMAGTWKKSYNVVFI